MLSCEFSEVSKNNFFTEHLQTTILLLAFQKQPPEVIYEKDVLENLAKFTEKHLWFVKFSRTPLKMQLY